ncbi:interleukin-7 receptor subunit alpha isoform X2 [Anabas testudineus]|uniref:interleukin-7 receptor subunit alpha isoform X2 n=1 Tax=Anabas testudineus TaxID=64144 RepID=UPI000E463EA8|nr:interleukin-7 receptor subunit alpha isoform X2 [Anabas testudineus]
MVSSCRMALLLLLLLLLLAGTRAQSGDRDTDMDPTITCTSDITTEGNNLTCRLLGGQNHNEDDEDDESDSIEKMHLCYTDYSREQDVCLEGVGDSIGFTAPVFVDFNLTVTLKGGGSINKKIDLRKIVKPRSPYVKRVLFNLDSNQAVISIQTPYHNEYLKIENQLFQLHICTTGSEMTQNLSASDSMKIDMKSIQRDAEYRVKVRAIPINYLQGSWSEWSETYSFITPAGVGEEKVKQQTDERQKGYILIVCLVSSVVVAFSAVFLWKNKIFTYMWPSIPHPKHTLVQICKPNKGLLLNFKPEVFSALKVYPVEKTEEEPGEEAEPSANPAAADETRSNNPSSTQSSDCRSTTSVSTEELELSALLSSSDAEETLQSTSPSPINMLQHSGGRSPQPERSEGGNQAKVFGVHQQEEAYVTMSSFYQIK